MILTIYLDLLKYYFADKTNFTIKGKMVFLNKALVKILRILDKLITIISHLILKRKHLIRKTKS